MISKGSLVRIANKEKLSHLNIKTRKKYPNIGSLCIVLSSPRKKDLAEQLRGLIPGKKLYSLKSCIDVMSDGAAFYDCELAVFQEVKKNDRTDM
tara:strand:- start:90 stop:371 length:282 start_codon:yes stop_codon:yes gene_type:complete